MKMMITRNMTPLLNVQDSGIESSVIQVDSIQNVIMTSLQTNSILFDVILPTRLIQVAKATSTIVYVQEIVS